MTGAPPVTQETVDALVARLDKLRQAIAEARQAIAPLRQELELAEREYLAAAGPARREARRLESQLALRAQEQRAPDDSGHLDETPPPPPPPPSPVLPAQNTDPEALDKDQLLEHVFRVLEPDVNPEDARLFTDLDSLVRDPARRLSDALDVIPWGPVWTTRATGEDLAAQYRRLSAWERALAERLQSLQTDQDGLRSGERYRHWQQRRQGPVAWKEYLDREVEKWTAYADELRAELQRLEEAQVSGSGM